MTARRDLLVTSPDVDLGDWRRVAPRHNRPLLAVGLGVIVSVVVVVLSVTAGALVVHRVSAALFSGDQPGIRSGSPISAAGPDSLKLQSKLVEQRRAAVAAYAAQLAGFKIAMSRQPDALGLDAAEAIRRDDVLSSLVLTCIDAVERYNLAAQALPIAQLRSAGLRERFAWAFDCAQSQ